MSQTWKLAPSLQQQESLVVAQDWEPLLLVAETQAQVREPVTPTSVPGRLAAEPLEQELRVAAGQAREPVAQYR